MCVDLRSFLMKLTFSSGRWTPDCLVFQRNAWFDSGYIASASQLLAFGVDISRSVAVASGARVRGDFLGGDAKEMFPNSVFILVRWWYSSRQSMRLLTGRWTSDPEVDSGAVRSLGCLASSVLTDVEAQLVGRRDSVHACDGISSEIRHLHQVRTTTTRARRSRVTTTTVCGPRFLCL